MIKACPLPRWPQAKAALAAKGWKVHHLARALKAPASQVHAWLYGQEPMPERKRRQAEEILGLPANAMD